MTPNWSRCVTWVRYFVNAPASASSFQSLLHYHIDNISGPCMDPYEAWSFINLLKTSRLTCQACRCVDNISYPCLSCVSLVETSNGRAGTHCAGMVVTIRKPIQNNDMQPGLELVCVYAKQVQKISSTKRQESLKNIFLGKQMSCLWYMRLQHTKYWGLHLLYSITRAFGRSFN